MDELNHETWKRIFPWLQRAHEVPAEELNSWLDRLIADQPDIGLPLRTVLGYSREIEAQEFLARPYEIVPETTRIGQQVGAYTIESLLGQGGMGEVWLARRSDGRFKGLYAVKFLWLTSSAAAADRFRREGRLLARLAHPNIARLIDAGTMNDGQSYLILEYVKGEHIDAHCKGTTLGLKARLRLFLKVLDAVAHAHTNLIVHRDIKPSNVMVTAEGDVKLLDFGIAKLVGSNLADDHESLPTRIEDAALTPEYAAPEQILGEPPSTATDVYQLGVLLYLLLVERLPFSDAGPNRAARIRAALDVVPLRVSQIATATSRNALRGDLDAIVAKALRKRPDERYPTAAALAADLERYLNDEPVAAREGALSYRAGKFVRRYQGAVFGTAAAVLALAITAGFALAQMREAQIQRSLSQFNEKRAEAENEFLFEVISTIQSDGRAVTTAQILDEGIRMLDTQYADDPEFRAVMYIHLAARYGDPRNIEKAYAITMKAEAIALELDDPYLMSQVECDAVEPLYDMGHLSEAVQRLALGRKALARVAKPPVRTVAECMDAGATIAAAQGNMATAIDTMKETVAYLERSGETRDILYLDELSHLGYYYHEMGDTRNTFAVTQRTVDAFESSGRGETRPALTAQHNLAMCLLGFGEVKNAFAVESRTISRARAGANEVQIEASYSNGFGTMLLRLNQPEAALQSFDAALAVARKSGDLARQFNALVGRARAHVALDRLDDAEADLAEFNGLKEGQEAANGRAFAQSKAVAVELLLARGKLEEARRQGDSLLQELREATDTRHAELDFALLMSTRVAIADHRYGDAERAASEAVALYRKLARNPDASADVGEALLRLSEAERDLGEVDKAKGNAAAAVAPLTSGLGADHPLTLSATHLAGAQDI